MKTSAGIICLLVVLHVHDVTSHTLYQYMVDGKIQFHYSLNQTGVYHWPEVYSEHCGGVHQSPIDIQTEEVRNGVICQCPRMIFSSNILKGIFTNNGHSAVFKFDTPTDYMMTNVPHRPGLYYLHDFHMHYGGIRGRNFDLDEQYPGNDSMHVGSEHTLDGRRFAGEVHFVFFNSKYRDIRVADDKPDGIVVIAIWIQALPGTTVDSVQTSGFSEFLLRNIPAISSYQTSIPSEVNMSMFFNRDCEFYTYSGSTTTPPCHESVRWLIRKKPLLVTERAWFELTGLSSLGELNAQFGNYRPVQPLNGRVVEFHCSNTVSSENMPQMVGVSNAESANMPQMVGVSNEESTNMPQMVGVSNEESTNMPQMVGVSNAEPTNMPQMVGVSNTEPLILNIKSQRRPFMKTVTFKGFGGFGGVINAFFPRWNTKSPRRHDEASLTGLDEVINAFVPSLKNNFISAMFHSTPPDAHKGTENVVEDDEGEYDDKEYEEEKENFLHSSYFKAIRN